ncbi:hypothetical protein M885DRAFT_498406 [Pelagophyceae sp. CCMP2097]|nr:hypothetical protein M885DRAFT_498406 [Pelagophyceae sp. CCMP2097]
MLDFNACFEPALRAIIDALIRDHATDEEEDLDGSFHGAVAASLRGVAVAVSAKKLLALSKKYDAEMQDDENVPEDGARGAGEERVSRMQRLRLRLTGRHATRGSPSVETPRPSQTQATPPAPGEAGRRHDAFFDLAAHAHAANFECWVDMEEAAAAILADPDWGARISALEDFSDGAVLQTPLRDPHLAAWVAGLGGDSKALREQFDEAVLPHALRSVALDAHPAFIAALQALLCEPDDDAVDDDGGGENLRASWVSKCELYKSGASTAVKSAARMSVKVDEYCCEDGPASSWPRAARITDPLRATVVCDDAEAIVRVYTALVGDASAAHTFRVTRLKNKLALCTKPFNLHVNCAFDRGAGAAPITTEIQIIPRAVNAVTGPSHKFYTLSRASHAGALVT